VIVTNRYKIPSTFENFIDRNQYDSGESDISVTTLIDSPRIRKLQELNDDKLSEDVSDRIMSILGSAVHNILEVGCPEGSIAEKRFFAETKDGKVLSGQADLIEPYGDGFSISDYKVVRGGAISANPDGKQEWRKQLNCYAWLASKNGFKVNKLQIVAIVRDWVRSSAERNPSYPQSPVICIDIQLDPLELTEQYIEGQVKMHFDGGDLPECSDEERWRGSDVHAVMEYAKGGGLKSRAKRLFSNSYDATAYMLENNINGEVVLRKARPVRCEGNYCSVAEWCEQYQNEKDYFDG
jgi:hypothetical protein